MSYRQCTIMYVLCVHYKGTMSWAFVCAKPAKTITVALGIMRAVISSSTRVNNAVFELRIETDIKLGSQTVTRLF